MKTLAIVIHGFCKGAKDMQLWKRTLEADFSRVITPDLPTKYSSFECCVLETTTFLALCRGI